MLKKEKINCKETASPTPGVIVSYYPGRKFESNEAITMTLSYPTCRFISEKEKDVVIKYLYSVGCNRAEIY